MASSVTSLESGLREIAARIAPGAEDIASLRALSGGASQETWAFDACGPGMQAPLVLRRAGPGAKERSRNSAGLDTEAALIRLAARQGVPVPNVRYVLQADDGIGAGFIMDRIEGETIARKILRDKEFDAVRPKLARECGRHIARIHQIDPSLLPPLKTTTTEGELEGYFTAYRRLAGHARRRPVFELAFRWLRDRLPRQAVPMTLVHGDFRHGNLMIGPDGVRAVLDWELAHIGDPMKDLGWICTNSWRFGSIDLPVGGFGTREELFAGYEEAGGRVDAERVMFWEVFGSLKWGVMCEEMVATFVSGTDPSVERAAIGRRVSETEIDLMRLLARQGD
jgi:aminoglycoside phosphotransferase (APT) family kinase protein